VSYASIAQLALDESFQDRVKSCVTIECQANLNDLAHPDQSNLAYDTLRGAPHVYDAIIRLVAQTPAVADAAGDPPDQSLVSDDLIQVSVQDSYAVTASLYYNPDGTPWSGAVGIEEPPPEPPIDEIPPGEIPPIEPVVNDITPLTSTTPFTLTIYGQGLTDTTMVNIYVDATNVVVVDDTQVTADFPSIKKGTYPVLVTVGVTQLTGPNFTAT